MYALLTGAHIQSPPVAELSYRNDFGEWPEQACCLRLDPVHLRADTNGLILFDTSAFDLDKEDSEALRETVAEHLLQDGLTLKAAVADRWYVLADAPQHLHSTPLPLLRGAPLSVSALTGEDAAVWRNRLNELEMLLSTHAVNQRRLVTGQMPVNSLCLWGESEGGIQSAPRFTGVSGADPCLLGYAQAQQLPIHDLDQAADMVARTPAGAHLLVFLDNCRTPAVYEDFQSFIVALERLETLWIKPLLAMLSRRQIDSLELLPLNGKRYRLNRLGLWSLWKSRGDYRNLKGFQSHAALRV